MLKYTNRLQAEKKTHGSDYSAGQRSGGDDTDAALVRKCLRGDAAAWDLLVERYGRLVYSVPRRLGLSAPEADDVFQAVFMIVFQRLGALRDIERLSGWLIRIAHRESWRLARRRRLLPAPGEDQVADAEPTEAQVAALEEAQHVREALTLLNPRDRRLLEILFFEGGPSAYQDAAEELQMPLGSIGPTRMRALRKLEALLNQRGVCGQQSIMCA